VTAGSLTYGRTPHRELKPARISIPLFP